MPGARAFVLAETRLQRVPSVPEVALHLAEEAHGLWLKTEAELQSAGLAPPFWAFAWAGGQGLARFILDHPAVVAGRRVVDFASGSGLVAIAARKAGASHVTAVDIDPFCGAAILLNAEANGVSIDIAIKDPVGKMIKADILLAGDVFFDRAMSAAIIPWFDRLAGEGVQILIGDPGRAYVPVERLERLAVHRVPTSQALEDADFKATTVWRWRRGAG
ncbi:class I SAM-dependent methyltransferase [Consotaella salsifontis]|uniref:class I SAM-dependent methyltransferase n=1 Tax=Consotaella salsifontis TaxID=1365950 RepID=UPI001FDACAEC|nr:methyltransferase [Consotaella salsifontis]